MWTVTIHSEAVSQGRH